MQETSHAANAFVRYTKTGKLLALQHSPTLGDPTSELKPYKTDDRN